MSKFVEGFERRFGYPPGLGENRVVREDAPALGTSVPDELLTLYSQLHEISLPDLGNGVFVSPLADVVEGTLTGAVEDAISLRGSAYDVSHVGHAVVAKDLSEFLEGIRGELLRESA